MVNIIDFGKDHWSLLAYIETLCVESKDNLGIIDKRKVRCNEKSHPLLNVNNIKWNENYGTRLKGYYTTEGNDSSKQLKDHDDWDCLEDLDNAGLIEFLTIISGGVTMTKKGMKVVSELREHKSNGGMFSNFIYNE